MFRDCRALICFGSKGEGCEEATGVGWVGEEAGAEAGGRVLVAWVAEVTVVMVVVVVVVRRRTRKRNGGVGFMVLREKVALS